MAPDQVNVEVMRNKLDRDAFCGKSTGGVQWGSTNRVLRVASYPIGFVPGAKPPPNYPNRQTKGHFSISDKELRDANAVQLPCENIIDNFETLFSQGNWAVTASLNPLSGTMMEHCVVDLDG
ncbi:hypothetical protein TNCV_3812881 [Trichonephila clavipes]|nr:hypothetical protein TNCV_3812881 [Trichonephila clavipes]